MAQSKAVLDGRYEATVNTDQAMLDLFEEIAQIREVTGPEQIKEITTGDEWSSGWQGQ
jgi:hypothetical protein